MAQTAAYSLSDHCLCVLVTHTHTQAHSRAHTHTHCSGRLWDLSQSEISFPLCAQLFMWCVAWLDHYSSASCIQFSSLVLLQKSSKTQQSLLSVCETLHLGLFIMTPGKVNLPDDNRQTKRCCCQLMFVVAQRHICWILLGLEMKQDLNSKIEL